MLSRVANSIYWLSRYMERADNVARFIDVNLQMILDLPSGSQEQWHPLVSISGGDAAFSSKYPVATRDNVIKFLTFDEDNPSSIVSCLRAARENDRTIRESISPEMWEQVNQFYLMVNSADAGGGTDPQDLFASVRMAGHLFAGVTDATMTHNESWNFCRQECKTAPCEKACSSRYKRCMKRCY